MPLTMTKTSGIALDKPLEEWADLYARRLYNLAYFEAEAGTSREPDNPLHWFLLGESALARNRPNEAKDAFARVSRLLNTPGGANISAAIRTNMGRAAQRLSSLLEENPLLPAPAEPFRWIEEPDSIDAGSVLRSASGALGRQEGTIVHKPGSLVDAVDIFDPETVALAPKQDRGAAAPPKGTPATAAETPAPTAKPAAPRPAAPAEVRPVPKVAEVKSAAAQPAAATAPADPWRAWEQDLLVILSRGKYDEARQRVEDAVRRYPDNTWLREHRAAILERMGQKEGAARELASVFDKLARKGDHRSAEKVARQAMALSRGNGGIILGLGTAAAAAGMLALASDALSLGVETERRSGDPDRLRNALSQATEVFPGNPSWQQELSRLTMNKQRAAGPGGRPAPAVSPARNTGGDLVLPPTRGGRERQSPPTLQGVPAGRSEGGNVPTQGWTAGMSQGDSSSLASSEANLLATFLGSFSILVALLFTVVGIGLVGWILFFILTMLDKSNSFKRSPEGKKRLETCKYIVLALAIIGTLRSPFPL